MPLIRINTATAKGFNFPFVIGDWIDNGSGLYYLNIEHEFNSNNIQAEIFDNSNVKIGVHDEIKHDDDNYRLFVPTEPDLRFSGIVHLVKT